MVIKLMYRKLSRSNSKNSSNNNSNNNLIYTPTVKWELRPGGMVVQRREPTSDCGEEVAIRVRVSMGIKWCHEISIDATSTFGELKALVAMSTGLEPKEQRMLFKGKERDDDDHLHMVGVQDMDKVVVMEDPATKERRMHLLLQGGGSWGAHAIVSSRSS